MPAVTLFCLWYYGIYWWWTTRLKSLAKKINTSNSLQFYDYYKPNTVLITKYSRNIILYSMPCIQGNILSVQDSLYIWMLQCGWDASPVWRRNNQHIFYSKHILFYTCQKLILCAFINRNQILLYTYHLYLSVILTHKKRSQTSPTPPSMCPQTHTPIAINNIL